MPILSLSRANDDVDEPLIAILVVIVGLARNSGCDAQVTLCKPDGGSAGTDQPGAVLPRRLGPCAHRSCLTTMSADESWQAATSGQQTKHNLRSRRWRRCGSRLL